MSTPEQPQDPRVAPAATPLNEPPTPEVDPTSTPATPSSDLAKTSPPVAPGSTPAETPDVAADGSDRRDRDDRTKSADAFPVPTGPTTTGFGGHILGIIVGFALTLLAGVLVVLGQSRILADGVGRVDITPDTLGIVLVTLGVVVAGSVVLLGVWTPAAPFTGGLLTLAVGAAFLFAPIQAHRETVRLISTDQNRVTVLNSITVATTGGLVLAGVLMLAAAIALSIVRRRGLALGAFREQARAS